MAAKKKRAAKRSVGKRKAVKAKSKVKKVAKRTSAKRSTVKKSTKAGPKHSRRKAAKKTTRTHRLVGAALSSGFVKRKSGLVVPGELADAKGVAVPPSRLGKGLRAACAHLDEIIESEGLQSLGSIAIQELTVEVGISAEGKFLGFGASGGTKVVIKFIPKDPEDGLDDS